MEGGKGQFSLKSRVSSNRGWWCVIQEGRGVRKGGCEKGGV
jgi:hypothetical protein